MNKIIGSFSYVKYNLEGLVTLGCILKRWKYFSCLVGICLAILFGLHWQDRKRPISRADARPVAGDVIITPDQMNLDRDTTTRANCVDADVCSWISAAPSGTILLGVDPASPDPQDWDGGAATIQLALADYANPTLLALEVSWPDQDGKGLHSPLKNQMATIAWDGKIVWDMRTVHLSDFGDYYAAQHHSILTTLVITQAMTHTLEISVSPHTAWDISQITIKSYAYPTPLRGIGYSPYRDCQYPGGDLLPTQSNIVDDLDRLVHTTNAIRTYAATGVNAQIPALVNAYGLHMFAGAWIEPGSDDETEIQGLIHLAQTTDLAGVIVGNEYYLRNRTPEHITYLASRIDEVKSQISSGIPVMSAEVDDLMFTWADGIPTINPDYRTILDRVDYVMVHVYPFWSGMPIDGAAQYVVDHYLGIETLIGQTYPGQGKRVVIGETGWPSGGADNNQAVPSLENQRRFYLEFLDLAAANDVDYFYFDAFDELWKIEEAGGVGQRWGYAYADRSAKHPEYGTLLPSELLSLPLNDRVVSGSTTLVVSAANSVIRTVYDEWPEDPTGFISSGWMGDLDQIDMYACDRSDPFSGEMALQAEFGADGDKGWGGVYWQYPANNWGDLPDGIDLSQANKLTFRAKGQLGGEKIRFIVGGIGTQEDLYPDSLRPAAITSFITLDSDWQEYTINLKGKDLSHVIGGFGWVTDRFANPQGAVFYLDLIRFEFDPDLPDPSPHGEILSVYTDVAAPDNHFVPSGFMVSSLSALSLTERWLEDPHAGSTSVRVQYMHDPSEYGGGVYWVDPAENWGDRPGGIDLTGATRLTFWARSDTPGVPVKFMVGGVGYVNHDGVVLCYKPAGDFPDSVCPPVERIFTLDQSWRQYTIDLMLFSRDYRGAVGGFGFYVEEDVTFYLDDILYRFDDSWMGKIFLPFVLR